MAKYTTYLHLHIDAGTKAKLARMARQQRITMSEMCRRIIQEAAK